MPRIGQLAVVLAAMQFATAGCAFGRKPYSNDPLIKANRAVRGDREKGQIIPAAVPEPVTPPAPSGPLIGSELVALPISPP
jgi:hypothetical protein